MSQHNQMPFLSYTDHVVLSFSFSGRRISRALGDNKVQMAPSSVHVPWLPNLVLPADWLNAHDVREKSKGSRTDNVAAVHNI